MDTTAFVSAPASDDRPGAIPHQDRPQSIDKRRYWRTLSFFAGVIANLIWWEIILRATLGRRLIRKNRPERLRRYASRFRGLAVQMGGVMIKLGQFFSARVDVLPREITRELANLQDEVPAESFEVIRPIVEAELGPIEETFAWFGQEAHAAASLGQVHRARLHNEERVVVKVQRPRIRQIVATDLAALEVVGGWVMRYKPVRRRADVPALLDEFAKTLWEELDYESEADNAERFGEIFARDLGVYVPETYRDYTTRRVLTLEDVTSIKITDHERIDAAGVDRKEAARRLFRLYLTQIFEHRFFHADPHPGNLFVYPWPPEAYGAEPGSTPDPDGKRPFYLVFVDFGMVGHVTDNVLEGLREGMAAIATRDMRRLIRAYEILDVLLPDADVGRIVEAEQRMFERVEGLNIQQMRAMQNEQVREFMLEFGDLLYEMPFQVPQDFIYLGRAMGILSGMCTSLDPAFNPWEVLMPFARKLVREELRLSRGGLLGRVAQALLSRQSEPEPVTLPPIPSATSRQPRLITALNRLAVGVVVAGFTLAGTLLVLNGERAIGIGAFGLAGVGLAALWKRLGRRD